MKNARGEKAFGVGCTESPVPVRGPHGDRAAGHTELLSWALRGAEPVTRHVIPLSLTRTAGPPGTLFILLPLRGPENLHGVLSPSLPHKSAEEPC